MAATERPGGATGAGAATGPLAGIRVVDFTNVVAGPYATMILADQGADVIKIEGPRRRDFARGAGPGATQLNSVFLNNNRNKRSLSVDATTDAGREILLRLVATADVFVQNYRPGVMTRLGIDEPAVRAVNERIVYVSMSGFGESGPFAHKPVYDPLIQALSGLTTVQAGSDEARPKLIRTILPDKLTGMTSAQAISSALLARERTGQGQHVRLSMLDSVVAFMWSSDMGEQTFLDREVSAQAAATIIDLIYDTRTGHITISTMTNDQWAGFCRAAERPELIDDPRFRSAGARHRNADERLALIQEILMTQPAEHWLKALDRQGVPCAPVLTRAQAVEHPQIQASGILVESEHPRAGRLRQARGAARFEGAPMEIRHGAPLLGEHTEEVLAELGYSGGDVAGFVESGVVSVAGVADAEEDVSG